MKTKLILPGLLLVLVTVVRAAELGEPAAPLEISQWVKGDAVDLAAATNAQYSDQELLLEGYENATDFSQKVALTWALACIGRSQAVTNLMNLLTNQFKRKELDVEEEDLAIETIQALGFLATRYEAPFEFLKRGIHADHWRTNRLWLSPRGYESAGLLA